MIQLVERIPTELSLSVGYLSLNSNNELKISEKYQRLLSFLFAGCLLFCRLGNRSVTINLQNCSLSV
jgi:hypothetical protein